MIEPISAKREGSASGRVARSGHVGLDIEMTKPRQTSPFRVSLQLKSAVILTFVVLTALAVGGWFYYDTTDQWLVGEDGRRAMRIAQALGLAAQKDLVDQHYGTLQSLAKEYLRNDNIQYVAILDARGESAASASRDVGGNKFAPLLRLPVSVSATRRLDRNTLSLAHPIILSDTTWYKDRLAGSVRLVLDTSKTTASLRQVRDRMMVIGVIIAACVIPFGYLLVWHVVGQPVRDLVGATRRLARGDFTARTGLKRADEIGELAGAFNMMAGEVSEMRDELLDANEQLEQKVAGRTRDLEIANGRLRDEIAEKEDFLRAVSHDLNAPLRNIAGIASMLVVKGKDTLPSEAVDKLNRIRANVEVETSLIGELLELSRIRTRPQRREVVDIGGLVRKVADTFEFDLKQRRIDLQVASHMPFLWVDKSRMHQVFQNLIDNAIKYMHRDEGGRIVVEHELADGAHEFRVVDNGPGIAPDQLEKVFYVFRRARSVANSKVPGKGVGLALVKGVAANYDGRAWVTSEEGKGSTFHVALSVEATLPPANPEFRQNPNEKDRVPTDHHPVG